jgi:hypothetical protein
MSSERAMIRNASKNKLFKRSACCCQSEQIYKDLYQSKYEKEYPGRYMAIDVMTKRAYVAGSEETAIATARAHVGNGLFHVIRIQPSSKSKARLKWLP